MKIILNFILIKKEEMHRIHARSMPLNINRQPDQQPLEIEDVIVIEPK